MQKLGFMTETRTLTDGSQVAGDRGWGGGELKRRVGGGGWVAGGVVSLADMK